MDRLRTELCGLDMRNPTILAAGIWGESGASLRRCAEEGAGAVVTKSIGIEPRKGHKNPTVVEGECWLLNAMGLPNPGIEAFAEEMRIAVLGPSPVIGSVFGSTVEEFSALAAEMESYGAKALELNLSCPHAKGYGAELGQDPGKVEEITSAVKGEVKVPVLVKLTPNTSDIPKLAEAARDGGADAVVAINTVKGMAINAELKRPVLANRFGGLSGPAVKPVGLRCVYEIKEAVDIPIIGAGGISCGRDAVEYILAGASAVQVGTAVKDHGVGVFKKICGEMLEFMDAEGVKNISELVGAAHNV